jgi:hypothetical protein
MKVFMGDGDFDKSTDAVKRLKDRLPRELVARLRSMGIPIPQRF